MLFSDGFRFNEKEAWKTEIVNALLRRIMYPRKGKDFKLAGVLMCKIGARHAEKISPVLYVLFTNDME